jgi:hypothetical protein
LNQSPFVPAKEAVNLSISAIWHELNTPGLMVRRRAIAGAACVHLAAMRAVSNHGGRFGLAAILRDALASLGLLRMRSEW